jgi:TonB-linked SusC/RagA family outer membrane protein
MGNTARQSDVTAAISGGNQQSTFLLSSTYHREEPVLPDLENDGYKRVNVKLNIGHISLDKRFNLNVSSFYTTDYNKLAQNILLLDIARAIPNYPIYNESGNYNWLNSLTNHIAYSQAYAKTQTDNLNGNFNLRYTLFPGLDLKSSIGYNKVSARQVNPRPSITNDPNLALQGRSDFADQYVQSFIAEPQITYNFKIGPNKINILAGTTLQQTVNEGKMFFVNGYSSDLLLESMNYGTIFFKSANKNRYAYTSVYGRVSYNLTDKYLLNLNFRRDGSSRFGPGNQFANFGSIGAAWHFSQESFIQESVPWISYGKLRGSFGSTGSDGIGDYAYLSLYSSSQYGNGVALVPSQIANANFRWEVNRKLEMALDLGFLEDRLLLNIVWYRNRSGNQLVQYALPSITGFNGYTANLPAVIENKGWELELNTVNVKQRHFNWSSALNITIPKNKLLEFPGLETSSYANSYVIGQPLNIVQRYRFLGVDPQTGLSQIEDQNGDGIYTPRSSYNNQAGDYVFAGTTDPRWFGGLSNNLRLRNFQLDIFFQYVKQSGYNLYSQPAASAFGRLFNVWTDYLDYWKQPGDRVVIPKPLTSSNPSLTNFQNSDAGISDASFLRLKNVSLSYSLPSALVNKAGLQSMRVYLLGQNLWTHTRFIGYDPETAGNNNLMIPPLKMLTVGVQCVL